MLTLKQLAPTRLIKNEFYEEIRQLEAQGASKEAIQNLLGKGRAKKGIFEGNLTEGELEIGQAASMLKHPETVKAIFHDLIQDYNQAVEKISHNNLLS